MRFLTLPAGAVLWFVVLPTCRAADAADARAAEFFETPSPPGAGRELRVVPRTREAARRVAARHQSRPAPGCRLRPDRRRRRSGQERPRPRRPPGRRLQEDAAAAQDEAHARGRRGADPVGEDGRPLAGRPRRGRQGRFHRRGAAEALVVSAGEEAGAPDGQRPFLGEKSRRRLRPGKVGGKRPGAVEARRPAHADPPRHVRPDRPAADAGRSRGVRAPTPSPDAYERLVDRLLASPHYGERWGRHWLDVARYADTKGYVFTEERRYPFSYTYRDYVIRAFNEDLPYDQFIVQQLAADRLPLGDGQAGRWRRWAF